MTAEHQLGKGQVFDWGSILWFTEPGDMDVERMSVGLVSFLPCHRQEEHLHSGEEQVVYVVSGQGQHLVNGIIYPLQAGELSHIPPYARHQVYNLSPSEELKLIITYTPSRFQRLLSEPAEATGTVEYNDLRHFIDLEALRGLMCKLSEALSLSLSLLDTKGEIIIQTDGRPRFCEIMQQQRQGEHCRMHRRQAIKTIQKNNTKKGRPQLFLCCHQIASVIIPVLDREQVQGYITCGEVFLNKPSPAEIKDCLSIQGASGQDLQQAYQSIEIQPKSRLYAAAEATFAIASYIADMTSAALRQKELDSSRLSLIHEQMNSAKLEKALREADMKLLQSQLNPHFLFNTLNTIAQQAYLAGADKAAELVWNLSDLLRVTLRKNEEKISLQEELSMLKRYLQIQEARFGDRLSVRIQVEPGLEEALIPGMLLQPLVENALVHGLEPSGNAGELFLQVYRRGAWVCCQIEDNGVGCDPEAVQEAQSGIGLRSVKNRLQYYYKNQFTFRLTKRLAGGIQVFLTYPLERSGHEQNQSADSR